MRRDVPSSPLRLMSFALRTAVAPPAATATATVRGGPLR